MKAKDRMCCQQMYQTLTSAAWESTFKIENLSTFNRVMVESFQQIYVLNQAYLSLYEE
jgi:hypothetical protein